MARFWFDRGNGGWQIEFLLWRLQVRIGSQQQAAWWYRGDLKRCEYVWLFNFGKRVRATKNSAA